MTNLCEYRKVFSKDLLTYSLAYFCNIHPLTVFRRSGWLLRWTSVLWRVWRMGTRKGSVSLKTSYTQIFHVATVHSLCLQANNKAFLFRSSVNHQHCYFCFVTGH